MTPSEKKYWQERAALLDPKAYVLRTKSILGANYYEVVPDGECWLMVCSFYCRLNQWPDFSTHRVPDIDSATALTAGTRIEFHSASSYGMYYTCRPAMVIGVDQRYENDPRGLYFERLERLRNIKSESIGSSVPFMTPNGTMHDTPIPASVTSAMVMSYSNSDVSWGGIAGVSGALNLGNEISDDHQNRIGQRAMFPFSRSDFDKFRCRGSNVAGNTGAYMAGNAQMTYCPLPADW